MRCLLLAVVVSAGCSSASDPLPRPASPDADAGLVPDAGRSEDAAQPADAGTPSDASGPAADAGPPRFAGAATVSWTLQSEGAGTSYIEALLVDRNDESVVYGAFEGVLRVGGFEIEAEDRPPGDGYLLRAGEDGRVISLRRVIEGRLVGACLAELSDGDVLLGGSIEAAVFGPDDPAPIVMPAQGDWTMVFARIARDGTVRWARRARGNVWQLSAAAGLEGRILIHGAFYGTLDLEAPDGSLVFSNETARGFWAELDDRGLAVRGRAVEGTAASTINRMITMPDGTVFFSGAFGDYPRGLTAIFGRGEPNETTLETVSSDDDPAFDTFIGAYRPDGSLAWVDRIRAYGWQQSGAEMIVVDGRPTIAVGVAGYPIGFADGAPEAVEINTEGALARYEPGGRLEWARSSPRFGRIFEAGGAIHTASGIYDRWDAGVVRIETEPAPGVQHIVLARFDPEGRARAASLLELVSEPDNGAPRMSALAIGGSGRGWLIAGAPSETIVAGGRRIIPPSENQRLVLVRADAP